MLIDCDTHPAPADGLQSLLPHMPRALQERFARPGVAQRERESASRPGHRYKHPSKSFVIPEGAPPGGGRAGSAPGLFIEQLLDGRGVDACLLLPIEPVNAWTDPLLVGGFCRALNDLFVEEWLARDQRFNLCLVVWPQDPAASADEIRRLAPIPGVTGVFLPLLNIRMGQAHYDPIYAAAEESGLPVVMHPFGPEGVYQGAPAFAGGIPTTYSERLISYGEIGMASLTSLVFEGTFEKFPKLRIVFAENGFTWAVPLMWRMDLEWRRLRLETPWVRRPPSEYVLEHVRFTTQPLEEPPPEQLMQMLSMVRAETTLLYSSDYPHWDIDEGARVLNGLDAGMRERIFGLNALDWFSPRMRVRQPAAPA